MVELAVPSALVKGGWVGLWLLAVGVATEGVRRNTSASPEVTRKIVHIGAGNAIVLAWWLHTPTWMGVAASVVFSAVALLSYRLPILPGINSVGRPSLGTFFYAVSIGVLTALFWPMQHPEFAVIGILTMTWGDGLAALVGQAHGHHPYQLLGSSKSWEGSLTMLMVSFAVCMVVLGVAFGWGLSGIAIAAIVALVATGLETISILGLDNLTVPLGSSLLAYGLALGWL
ncbi:MAG: SEC59/DGK1/VTE5 family protein [Cyanobacteria bacterium]|nr:SEC59/DGK1/VTE5 family protein [Cyanobacteriota bacterium]MDA0867733.1 SEC59/DGK1/VTE5 family protein [Cyanobacteriota bacterium]